MKFAQLYHLSTGYSTDGVPVPIPDVGSDSIVHMDGRFGLRRCIEHARNECAKRGRIGFTINSDNRVIRAYETI